VPLRNRVDPFGAIHARPERGLFTGNRGVIHDPATRTLLTRRWTTLAWIICRLDFGNRRRTVMGRNAPSGRAGWTELFFLDEVTALAAGHRPCFFCRRAEATDFVGRFAAASGIPIPRAADLDARLHAERIAAGNEPHPIGISEARDLPDGATVAAGTGAWAKRGPGFLPWSFGGYGASVSPAALPAALYLVTPRPSVGALREGYAPRWHPSAEG
jgi:hypothetical protein